MTFLVAGTVRIPADRCDAFRPHMAEMMAATRAEDGCIEYAFSFDAADPGLIRVFEIWRDKAALAAHGQAEHMKRWRAAGAEFGVSDRNITLYETASERPL
ncbi:MAG: putative quinol monooxygenase [Caulobacteraceae bacterium]|nr:putative quinol monooxygenase [Caulobacteraceae bacterium]